MGKRYVIFKKIIKVLAKTTICPFFPLVETKYIYFLQKNNVYPKNICFCFAAHAVLEFDFWVMFIVYEHMEYQRNFYFSFRNICFYWFYIIGPLLFFYTPVLSSLHMRTNVPFNVLLKLYTQIYFIYIL